jgi:ABC-type transporter Mla subunit MlaD
VGLGNQFLFYAGLGSEPIAEGELIPSASSAEGKAALRRHIAFIPKQDDSISMIISQVNSALENIDGLTKNLNDAFTGTSGTSLGRTMGSVEAAAGNLAEMPAVLREAMDALLSDIDRIMESTQPILDNLKLVSEDLSDPEGAVAQVLDAEGPVYTNLSSTLESVSGAMKSLEKTAAYVPAQLPQITVMLTEIQEVLDSVEDVLTAILNNPLLRNGVGERVKNQPTGTNMRDLAF